MRLSIVRLDFDCLLKTPNGVIQSTEFFEYATKVVICLSVVRLDIDCLLIALKCFI